MNDVAEKAKIKELISNRIIECCSRAYGFGITYQIENLKDEEAQCIEDITEFVLILIRERIGM